MEQITINQNENQNISILSSTPQLISLSNINTQDIGINNSNNQILNINQNDNQILYVDGGGVSYGINDVLVNGVSVVSNGVAYVVVPTKLSELINDEHYITEEQDPTVPSYIKEISLSEINSWNNKQDSLVSGVNIKTINGNSLLGSGNMNIGTSYTAGSGISINSENVISNTITSYDDLTDLPTIPSAVSDLTNDLDFVERDDLAEVAFTGNYNALSGTPIIPDSTSELINDSGFVSETDYASYLHGGVIKTGINSYDINSVGYLYADTQTYTDYGSLANTNFIGKGTLENVLTGKGFIDNTVNNLTNYTLSSNLSTVATTGDYDDLINKPSIPTVNNATLTIQKNGTNVTTFTANSSTNATANITVPTKVSDLTNDLDSGWITPTLNTGFTQSGLASAGDFMYRRIGNVVYLKGSVKGFTATSQACVQLPTGYRPATRIDFYGSESTDYIGKFMVSSQGNVTYLGGTRGSVSSGQWFNLCTSYITDDSFPN